MSDVKRWQYVVSSLVAFVAGLVATAIVQYALKFRTMHIVMGAIAMFAVGFYIFSVMEDVFLMHNLEKRERRHGRD